ncbi:MAG: glycosyltransferase family 2 protein [bacterium]|nr:glycosyltransferase family 2 protein [bacterium]
MNGKISTVIIILNWNGLKNTIKCLDSLLKITGVDYKVIVIDNGSEKDEASILRRKYKKKIEVYRMEKNLGFTGGCNYGIITAKKFNPDFFLLLNNDTLIDKNFLKNLTESATSDEKIGLASPIIYDYHNKNKVIFSGGGINWLFGKTYHKTNMIRSKIDCNFLTGCCLLINSKLPGKIGLLDNRFFAYFEDAAYSLSAIKAGYKCICEPKAVIFHKEGASSDKKGAFKTYLISRNRILFINTYAPFVVRIYFFFFNLIKLVFALIYFLITKQYSRARAFTKGYLDGNLGRGGFPTL